jgi:sugar lactone lactonase YvrE
MSSLTAESDKGLFANTLIGVGMGKNIFTVERDGNLYASNLKSNKWRQVGSGYNTQFLVADTSDASGNLFAIERDGTLYRVDPNSGDFEQIGADGYFKGCSAADAVDGVLYCTTAGHMFSVDLEDGEITDFGGAYKTKALWYWQDYVYTLEQDGSLYKVDAESGEYERHGDEGAYSDTIAATIHDGIFYAIENDGALGATNIDDGSYEEIDDNNFGHIRQLFSANGKLYGISKDGTLYHIDPD